MPESTWLPKRGDTVRWRTGAVLLTYEPYDEEPSTLGEDVAVDVAAEEAAPEQVGVVARVANGIALVEKHTGRIQMVEVSVRDLSRDTSGRLFGMAPPGPTPTRRGHRGGRKR